MKTIKHEEYRILRRNREMATVKKEWFPRKTHKIFRAGTAAMMVRAAIRKEEADNQLEEDGTFQRHYLGNPEGLMATFSDGKEILPSMACCLKTQLSTE